MNLSKLILGFATLAAAATAQANQDDSLAAGWNRGFYQPFANELSHVPYIAPSSSADQAKCDDFYSHVRSTGEMKILLGVGYYDFSEGTSTFTWKPEGGGSQQSYNYGENATLDQAMIKVYHGLLTARCKGSLQFCGFEETSDGVYEKTVKAPDGRRINARLELRSPSVSNSDAQNVGPLKAEQDQKSADVTSWFFGGIKNADLAIYNGHARKGGGPDFNPPNLLSSKHVNYAWYGKHTPGLNRLVEALSTPTKPAAVLMMSCNSSKLFEKQIEKAAPGIGFSGMNLVPTTGLVPVKGTIAGIDSFLKMQCQPGLAREFGIDADMARAVETFNDQVMT